MRFHHVHSLLCAVLVLLACVFVLGACNAIQADTPVPPKPSKTEAKETPQTPNAAPPKAEPQVIVTNSQGRHAIWNVELALTDAQRVRGLMHRQSLEANRGMLFVFPFESIQSFWMKNTHIPLDMIFIRRDMTVAGVIANAKPHDTSSYHISVPSRFVLEVNAGQAESFNIQAGDAVRFVNVPGL